MPIRVTNPAGTSSGTQLGHPWVGDVEGLIAIVINVPALTVAEVDANGYLKPGVPFLRSGALVTAGACYGVTVEPIKVANTNSAADLTAAGVQEVTVGTIGMVSRAIIEDTLGRALTAAELTGFTTMPCAIVLAA
jgi:hypothetical protein